jgi:hypothetical protein
MAGNSNDITEDDFNFPDAPTFTEQDFSDMTHRGRGKLQGENTRVKLAESLGQSDFAGNGLDDVTTRAKMGWANDEDFPSQQASFQRAYPEGELKQTSHGTLFRPDKKAQWDFVDPGFLDKFEPINDIADMSGTMPALAGETAAAFMIPEVSAIRATRMAVPLIQGAGAMAGELGRQFSDRDSTASTESKVVQGVKEGLFSVGGTVAGGWVGRKLHGEGLWEVNPPDRDIVKFAKGDATLKDLTPTQAANSPMWHRLGSQAETASSMIKDYKNEQNKSAVEFGRNLIDRSNLDPDVMRVLSDGVRTRKEQITSMLTVPPTTWEQAGKQVVGLVQKYAKESQDNLNFWYERAKAAGPVSFDLSNVQALGKEMTGSSIPVKNPTKDKTHEVFGAPSAELKNILTKLDSIKPRLEDTVDPNGKPLTAMQQLIDIRSELFNLAVPDIAGGKKPDLLAKKLYGELNQAMENPIGGNSAAITAWKSAQELARERFTDLETYQAMQLFRTGTKESGLTSAEVASMLVRPGKGEFLDEIIKMSDTVGDGSFEKLQDAFKSSLITGAKTGQDIIRKLDEWRDDPHTLAKFISPQEQQTLRQMGNDLNRLQASGLQETIDRYTKQGADLMTLKGAMGGLMKGADPRLIDEMNKTFGAQGSPEFMKLKAGLMNHIVESSIVIKDGRELIDPKKLRGMITDAGESGAKDYLDADDITAMQNLARYSEMVNRAMDGGSSMAGGQQVSGLNPFHNPISKAIGTAINMFGANRGYGLLLLSKPARRILIGDGSIPGNVSTYQLIGAIAGSALSEGFEETGRAFSQ